MPTFDVVSEVDMNEVTNALNQTNKEVTIRFDLKNTGSKCELKDDVITVVSDENFHLEQVVDVLRGKLAKRKVNVLSLKADDPVKSGGGVRQTITVRQGIATEMGRKIVKAVKDSKIKVQASIREAIVRVSGKKRDDLQAVMALLKEGDYDLPRQFRNFRD